MENFPKVFRTKNRVVGLRLDNYLSNTWARHEVGDLFVKHVLAYQGVELGVHSQDGRRDFIGPQLGPELVCQQAFHGFQIGNSRDAWETRHKNYLGNTAHARNVSRHASPERLPKHDDLLASQVLALALDVVEARQARL